MFESLKIGTSEFSWGSKTYIMGVINVTPDSFSGDGLINDIDVVVERAILFQNAGADVIDIGGESTRPSITYSKVRDITWEEEVDRVMPVIEELIKVIDIPLSIDTSKAKVAQNALDAGVHIVNDVWGLQKDPDMLNVVVKKQCPVVIMHNKEIACYSNDLLKDITSYLKDITENLILKGVQRDNIIIDPGIGFGKKFQHNIEILRRLEELKSLHFPILVGTSRKSFIGQILGLPVDKRLEGTAATVALSIANGTDIVRVHDVEEIVRVARVSDMIIRESLGNYE